MSQVNPVRYADPSSEVLKFMQALENDQLKKSAKFTHAEAVAALEKLNQRRDKTRVSLPTTEVLHEPESGAVRNAMQALAEELNTAHAPLAGRVAAAG